MFLSNEDPLDVAMEYLTAEFPDPEDLEAHLDATAEEIMHDATVRLTPVSEDEFVHHLELMSFFDKTESEKLQEWMLRDFAPWFPLGRDSTDGTAYRLVLDLWRFTNAVQRYSHGDREPGYVIGTEVLGLNVLGEKTSIQKPSRSDRRQQHSSDESQQTVDSASSADSAASTAKTASADAVAPAPSPGFVFHQLGRLQFYDDDEMPAMVSELDEDSWEETGYIVAARISDKDGHMDGIYVIFECLPDIDDGIWPLLENPQKVAGHRGTMPPSNVPFSYAFIGDKLSGRRFDGRIEWMDPVDRDIEIVRTVRLDNGRIISVSGKEFHR